MPRQKQFYVYWWILLLASSTLAAQQPPLPHTLTPAEEAAFPVFQQAETTAAIIGPVTPSNRVRTMAEWEEVQALVLSWTAYTDVLTEIVRYAVEECEVYILTFDRQQTAFALQLARIPMERVHLLPIGFNSIWMRDYGPWAVYHNYVDSLAISDYLYNRPDRMADDLVPHELADFLGLPLYNADDTPYRWIHAGGNFLRDGLGTAWSSDLVLKENTGKSGLELARYAQLFFGIEDYRILPRLPFDRIHHLDMHMRILDEETIAVNEYPPGVADGPQIEANVQWLRQHYRTPYGRTYEILRLPVPAQNDNYPPHSDYLTYANAIFINKSLLVPVYGDPLDSVALEIYRSHLPGYRVVGINCNNIIEAVGALHCVAKVVGVADPLYIAHPRLRDTYQAAGAYTVEAQVHHRSGIESVRLYYRTDTSMAYQSLPLIEVGAGNWRGTIPAQATHTRVHYYLEARALNGKLQRRPLPAPEAYYHFQVKPFRAMPTAAWEQSLDYLAPGMALQLFADPPEGATTYDWIFPGAEPSSSATAEATIRYAEAGSYPIRLRVANPVGAAAVEREAAIQVLPARELFQDAFTTGPQPTYWRPDNTGAPTTGWIWSDSEYCYGGHWQVQHQAATMPLERAYLRTALDLRELESATLNFKVAYAGHPDHRRMDELRVYLTTAEGQVLNVYNKGGWALRTSITQAQPYEPQSCSEWRQETINLRPWLGQQVLLTFESVGGQGGALFLDEVALSTNILPEVLIVTPAPDTLIQAVNEESYPLEIELLAYDPDGQLDKLEVFVNDTLIETFPAPPYVLEHVLPSFGRYCIQARAYDAEGAANWSEPHCIRYERETVATKTFVDQAYGKLFPNPVGEELRFEWQHPEAILTDVKLLDVDGRTVRRAKWSLQQGKVSVLPTEYLPPGVYQLQLYNKEEVVWLGKVVKL